MIPSGFDLRREKRGMVVICAGTSGYNLTMDARYVWMHQKRIQGSHFATSSRQSQANQLMIERKIEIAGGFRPHDALDGMTPDEYPENRRFSEGLESQLS